MYPEIITPNLITLITKYLFDNPPDYLLSTVHDSPKHHLPYTCELPATYLRSINCIIRALNSAHVTHRDVPSYEAFSLQVYRKE